MASLGFRLRVGSSVVVLGMLGCPALSHAQQVTGCPIAPSDYGVQQIRTFTDSAGRKADFSFVLPPGHDPSKPTGILMHFHGNNTDPDDSYVPALFELQEAADKYGLIAAGLKSIGTRVTPEGTRVREWLNTDQRLLHELLLSDFGGCFKLDRSRLYLEGGSQGTCFLSAVLSIYMWRDFSGGILGLCGCWGEGHYDFPVNQPAMRSRFKVFVENTTEDFLHGYGVVGMDIYKYNHGVDVRSDLARPGEHCVDWRANEAAALEWMIKGAPYADPDANQPHWQMVQTKHNGLEDVAYDPAGNRFVIASQRADVTDAVIEANEQVRWRDYADDPQGYLDWRLANFPEYVNPAVVILATSDYGATFTEVAKRPGVKDENLRDMVVAPDGSILVTAGLGLQKVNPTTKTLDPFAFADKLLYGLDRDDSNRLFAHGAVVKVQRSTDSGATWTELPVPVMSKFGQWVVTYGGGTLAVIGDDAQVRYSINGGDSFQAAALPAGTISDFAVNGQTFYAVMQDGALQVSTNSGAAWRAATLPGQVRGIEVLKNGNALAALEAIFSQTGMTYRSTDAGLTWVRERGAHNDGRMEYAEGTNGQAMMVTTRGIFRHSTGPLLDLGTAPPPIGGSTGGTSGSGGQGTSGAGGAMSGTGATSGTGAASGSGGASGSASGGTPASGGIGMSTGSAPAAPASAGDDGCGCRVGAERPTRFASLLALLMFGAARRKRRT